MIRFILMTIIRKKILYIYDEEFYKEPENKPYINRNLWPIGVINNKKYFFTNDERLFLSNKEEKNREENKEMVLISIYDNYYNINDHLLNKYIYKSILLEVTDLQIMNNKIIYRKNSQVVANELINVSEFNHIYNFLKVHCNFRLVNKRDESGVFYVNFLGEIMGIRTSTFIGLKDLEDNNNILISLRFLKDIKNNFYDEVIYEEENYKWFLEVAQTPGLIVIGGETGRGKTTFLYNLMDMLAKKNIHIISIEDPVEKVIGGVFQRELNTYIDNNEYNYNEILKSILRHNPNIIAIGEIRDKEGAFLCTRSLLTGHSILCTIHLSNWENIFIDKERGNLSVINNNYISNPIKENFLKRFEDFGIKRSYIDNYIKGFVFLDKNYKVNIIKN